MLLSEWIPFLLVVCPAKLMVSPICSLDTEMVRLISWNLCEYQVEAFVQGGVVRGVDENVVHGLLCPGESLDDRIRYSTPVV